MVFDKVIFDKVIFDEEIFDKVIFVEEIFDKVIFGEEIFDKASDPRSILSLAPPLLCKQCLCTRQKSSQ
jgi:hypothetical protein